MTQKHEPAMPWFTTSGINEKGLTAIEHAALVTGQPCSGTPWLDDMIRAQRRERLAGLAREQDIENHEGGEANPISGRIFNKRSREQARCAFADALIAALEGGAK